jgi:glycosyltransferase involved in cell wall biosynthesis
LTVADVLVVIPTYNEAATLPAILDRLRAAQPDADVLVVDDGSPDGTGRLADARAEVDPAIHVLHRDAKQGLGAAYVAGFSWGLERGYEVLVEMDADGSHAPEQLDRLLAPLAWADVTIGSRYVAGGSVVNWPRHRWLLSRGGNVYTRLAVRLPVSDATAGYRAYRAGSLRMLDYSATESAGYCFQIDMTRLAVRAGMTVVEVPVTFTERTVGDSKMSRAIVAEALWRVTVWGAMDRWRPLRDRFDGTRRSAEPS